MCLILDAEFLGTGIEEAAAEALLGGVRLFQYRDKKGSRRELYETGTRLLRRIRESGARLIINDQADIAAAVDADGVHLGQDDLPLEDARLLLGPERIIGISTHSPAQAMAAQAGGADYIGFGPVFPTPTKDAGPALGTDALRTVCSMVTLPVLAIGGITVDTAGRAVLAGAAGVAVISGILAAQNRQTASRDLISAIEQTRKAG